MITANEYTAIIHLRRRLVENMTFKTIKFLRKGDKDILLEGSDVEDHRDENQTYNRC